jgi:hypothetical protein
MKGEQDVIAIYEKRFMDGLTRLRALGEAREKHDAYRTGYKRSTRPRHLGDLNGYIKCSNQLPREKNIRFYIQK